MGKFNFNYWPVKSSKSGRLLDEESADLSTAPTSPYLDTDHLIEDNLYQTRSSASRESPSTSSKCKNLGSRWEREDGPFFGISLDSSTCPKPSAPIPSSSRPAKYSPVSVDTQTSQRPLTAHPRNSEIEDISEYEEGETPRDFVERRLGHTSVRSLASELGDFDDLPFYQPESPPSMNNDEGSPILKASLPQPSFKKRLQTVWQEGGYLFLLLAISLYSISFSIWWAVIGLGTGSWQGFIHSGDDSLYTTTFLVSLNSKLIEVVSLGMYGLSVGQLLSRRAISRASRGLDLSAMDIKLWITRPGAIVSRFAAGKRAIRAWPTLSLVSFLTVIAGLSYTSASNELVSPRLTDISPQSEVLFGLVKSSYANPTYIQQNCQTPITKQQDGEYAGSTCLAMEHVGQAYYNYLGYTQTWAQITPHDKAHAELSGRPPVTGQFYGNTTVQGSWIETEYSDMDSLYAKYGRVVNNVTVAMPHSGVISAAKDRKNSVLQPQNLGEADQYSFRAAVPSPALNVLCANMDPDDISPLVYTKWPHAKTQSSDIPGWKSPSSPFWQDAIPKYSSHEWLNKTVVDDIFGWGQEYGRKPPVFSALPIDYNTITNSSMYYGDSTYILMKSSATSEYTVCSMRVSLYSNCNTEYIISGPFANLRSHCDSSNENFAYSNFVPDAPMVISRDYPNVASGWALAVSLNEGEFAGNASNARMLTEFIGQGMNPSLPTVAEALSVLAGCTMLLSMIDAPFVHYWQYNTTILNPGVYQSFNASIVTSQYVSQATGKWKYIFGFSLLWVAIVDISVFFFLLFSGKVITDYTETENVFALGVNSPEDDLLAEHCRHDHEHGLPDQMLVVPFWITRKEGSGHSHFTGHPPNAAGNTDSSDDLERGLSRHSTNLSLSNKAAKKGEGESNGDIKKQRMSWRSTGGSSSSRVAKYEGASKNDDDIEMVSMSRRTTLASLVSQGTKNELEFV